MVDNLRDTIFLEVPIRNVINYIVEAYDAFEAETGIHDGGDELIEEFTAWIIGHAIDIRLGENNA